MQFPPTRLAQLTRAIDTAVGKGAAGVIGQSFDVRRLDGATNGSVTNNPALLLGFPAIMRRTTSRKTIEGATFDLVVFEGTCDAARYLQLDPTRGGDLLTESVGSPGYTGASYTFVQRRPPRKPIFVRTDVSANITRPKPKGGRADQQPATGASLAPGYLGTNKGAEWPLVLQDGLYAFTASGSPAVVMIGLQPTARVREGAKDNAAGMLPTELPLGQFIAYVPLLPGEALQERDILNCGNADRYEIRKMYTSEGVGVVGWICICERLPL